MEPTRRNTAEQFARLQEGHERALQASREQIHKWEQFKVDYEVLQTRLQTLPDKVSHDIMVPFGRFAFMPGQLYHTNEILALLGDNWFAKRSAKQAIEIVERRKQYVAKQLEDERRQLADWEARLAFTADFREEHTDTVEIREDFRQGEEKEKRKVRRARVGRGLPPRRVLPTVGKEGQAMAGDERLWARLDELELKEEEFLRKGDHGASLEGDAEGTTNVEHKEEMTGTLVTGDRPSASRSEVRGDNGTWDEKPVSAAPPLRIAVTHTKMDATDYSSHEGEETLTRAAFMSPADISRRFHKPAEAEDVVTARKVVRWDPELVSTSDEGTKSKPQQKKVPVTTKPFSGEVVERTAPVKAPIHEAPRKVSKFKASRQNKTT